MISVRLHEKKRAGSVILRLNLKREYSTATAANLLSALVAELTTASCA